MSRDIKQYHTRQQTIFRIRCVNFFKNFFSLPFLCIYTRTNLLNQLCNIRLFRLCFRICSFNNTQLNNKLFSLNCTHALHPSNLCVPCCSLLVIIEFSEPHFLHQVASNLAPAVSSDQIPSIDSLYSPKFALEVVRTFVMEALAEAVEVNQVHNRDPIGGSNENLLL